jgi:hypothetical protein
VRSIVSATLCLRTGGCTRVPLYAFIVPLATSAGRLHRGRVAGRTRRGPASVRPCTQVRLRAGALARLQHPQRTDASPSSYKCQYAYTFGARRLNSRSARRALAGRAHHEPEVRVACQECVRGARAAGDAGKRPAGLLRGGNVRRHNVVCAGWRRWALTHMYIYACIYVPAVLKQYGGQVAYYNMSSRDTGPRPCTAAA